MNATDQRSTKAATTTADRSPAPAPAAPAASASGDPSTAGVNATREPSFLLAKPEKRVLRAIAGRLPRWILPDDLTLLGIVAAAAICIAYLLSNGSDAWLWVASGLLVVHWLGDSLDGTLARVRGIQRPRYGYYLDHLVDAGATAAIAIGLGLSPHMLLSVGMLLGVAYLVLSVNVYLESQALGRFSIGYGLIGPTEVRVLLIALNTALALGLDPSFAVFGTTVTALDLAGVALAAGMLVLLTVRARRNLRELAVAEPAAPRGRLFGSGRPARSRGARPTRRALGHSRG
jgi:phosphatidylglycerophosphate synthase